MTTREIISTDKSSKPLFPYSQAVRVDHTLYFSGAVGLNPIDRVLREGVVEQTHQALKNIGEVLKAAGTDYSKVVKTTVLLASMNDFAAVNEVYKSYFNDKFPARAAYQVAGLPVGALVEIEGIAIVGDIKDV